MLGIQQLSGQDGLLGIFVGIEGGNALLGGAELLVGQPGLLQAVHQPVPGHQKAGAVRDLQVFRSQGNALGADFFHFLPQVLRVQRDAVAQDVYNALAENAGGQQMQGKFAVFIDDGVARVAAALVADYDVVVLGQQVNHAALALVAPVNANDCAVSHMIILRFIVLILS